MGNSNNKSVLVSKEDIESSKLKETKEISNSQVCHPLFFFKFFFCVIVFFFVQCFSTLINFNFFLYRFPLGVEYLM